MTEESEMKRVYMATHVLVRNATGWLFDGEPMSVALDAGEFVWVHGSYADADQEHDPLNRIVKIGDARTNGFDYHGNCIWSVPSEWCTFLDEAEAEQVSSVMASDQELLRHAQ